LINQLKPKRPFCLATQEEHTSMQKKRKLEGGGENEVANKKTSLHVQEKDNLHVPLLNEMPLTFGQKALQFFTTLQFPSIRLPKGVKVMEPYKSPVVKQILSTFFAKYYDDNNTRVFAFGINPGRFGGGITGIPFTDPINLSTQLGISHSIKGRKEPSGEFIYDVINTFGVNSFFADYYINSICPLGFTKNGKNYNFYDDVSMMEAILPFMMWSMRTQMTFGAHKSVGICLGTGKLAKIFQKINEENNLFESIVCLEHPRYIVQYKRSMKGEYLDKYVNHFKHAKEVCTKNGN